MLKVVNDHKVKVYLSKNLIFMFLFANDMLADLLSAGSEAQWPSGSQPGQVIISWKEDLLSTHSLFRKFSRKETLSQLRMDDT